MAILEIKKEPDPILRKVSSVVEHFDRELHQLLDSMQETLFYQKGVGLAAPQVGVSKRIFIVNPNYFDMSTERELPQKHVPFLEFINPILSRKSGKISFEEGCLSVPGVCEWISRSEFLTIDYLDRFGAPHRMMAEGVLSVAVQHENDHLEGILFTDHLSFLRRIFKKKKDTKAKLIE